MDLWCRSAPLCCAVTRVILPDCRPASPYFGARLHPAHGLHSQEAPGGHLLFCWELGGGTGVTRNPGHKSKTGMGHSSFGGFSWPDRGESYRLMAWWAWWAWWCSSVPECWKTVELGDPEERVLTPPGPDPVFLAALFSGIVPLLSSLLGLFPLLPPRWSATVLFRRLSNSGAELHPGRHASVGNLQF